MTAPRATPRSLTAAVMSVLMLAGALSSTLVGVALADSAPLDPASPATPPTVTADALPTVQMNGVAWSQVVVGTTVYVAGSFTSARPAGAAPGTQETPRNHLLAYDIRTGALVTAWAPSLNAQALVVAASPDGSTVYVGGDFTTVNGQTRNRVAALDSRTGALRADFRPSVSSQVRSIAVAGSTVYLGGRFLSIGGVSRRNIAAVTTAGALLPWAPVLGVGSTAGNTLPNRPDVNTATSTEVLALLVTSGGRQVVAAGRFDSINGVKATGIGAVDAVTGATRPYAINQLITNQGVNSGVHSLSTDGVRVYGTAYDFYGPGNLEGSFAVTADAGDVVWVNDCQGDTYASHPAHGALYMATHAHSCSQIGGFPEQNPRVNKFATAVSLAAVGTVGNGTLKDSPAWRGKPAPALQSWFPAMAAGKVTGQLQAGWTVTGSGDYVVYGGEFERVNGVAQQGLVRYAVSSVAPDLVRPEYTTDVNPTVLTLGQGTVRVSWRTTWDMDNADLTYAVLRSDKPTTPLHTVTAASQWWARPDLAFTDRTAVPGTTYTYRVVVTDPFGNSYRSAPTTYVTPIGLPAAGVYATGVLADAPQHQWRLGDPPAAPLTRDQVGSADLAPKAGATLGASGAIAGTPDQAMALDGTANAYAAAVQREAAPQTFSVEAWFRTTSTTGGRVVGFGDNATGLSGNYDRHVYLDAAGRVTFGVWTPTPTSGNATTAIVTPTAYNDGAWHHVVGSSGAGGMALYLDGRLVGGRTGLPAARDYTGFWKVGADRHWASSSHLAGTVDEVAVYPAVLDARQVARHAEVGRTGAPYNEPPNAAVTAVVTGAAVALDGGTSNDPDGEVRTHRWDLGDGSTATGPTVTHTYPTAGRYAVTLTVTDDGGKTATSTQVVSATGGLYAAAVLADGAASWWRLDQLNGTGRDSAGSAELTVNAGVTPGAAGVLGGDSSRASTFDGTAAGFAVTKVAVPAPQTFTAEAWIRTTSTTGGTVLGFGASATGTSTNHDRQLTMDTGGRLTFGVFSGGKVTVSSPRAYNDGAWHHVVGVSSPGATALYVDGQLIGTRTGVGPVQQFTGFWRVGGDSNWNGGPWFAGQIDEVAVYPVALGADQVVRHHEIGRSGRPFNVPPTASVTAGTTGPTVTLDGRGSADPDGTVAAHSWDFGDGTTGSGATVSHTYAAGTYRATLTVTDDRGKTATASTVVGLAGGGATGGRYSEAVRADGASAVWRLNESSGRALDPVRADDLTVGAGVTRGVPGAISGDADRGVTFSGTSTGWAAGSVAVPAPQVFSVEAWFRTTSTAGGKVVGFGDRSGSLSTNYDRHVYLDAAGKLSFGVWTPVAGNASATTVLSTPRAYNDGAWHHVVGTVAAGTVAFYVDGQLVEQRTRVPALRAYTGHWKLGGDRSWSGASFLAGSVDDVAVYPGALSAGQVAEHHSLGSTGLGVNVLPTAAFTASAARLGATVDGSGATDADGSVVAWAWEFGDGGTATGRTATHTWATPGTYLVTLTVTDDRGGRATTTQEVTALPNEVPTAAATAAAEDLTASFDGSGSADGDGDVVAHDWTFGDGATGSGVRVQHTYAAAGTYEVTLTVTDDEGATASTTTTVTATAPNEAPTAAAGVSVSDLDVVLDGAASTDPDGTVTAWAWQFGDGATATGATVQHAYARTGTYRVTLTVTDDDGATGRLTTSVTVTDPPPANVAPTAVAVPVGDGLTVVLDGSGSGDPDGRVTGWAWDLGDGTAAGGPTVQHRYRAAGTYQVTLTVTDDDGARATTTVPVTVVVPNVAPAAAVSATTTGLQATLDGSASSDPDGAITSYSWDFGDGISGAGARATHTYATSGTYVVTLTVTDDDGATGEVAASVTVTVPPAFVADTFARTASGGLGTAEVGGAWTVAFGTYRQSVTPGTATLALVAAANQTGSYLAGVAVTSADVRTTVALQGTLTGGGAQFSVAGRRVAADQEYRVRLRFLTNGQVAVGLTRLAGSATETLVGGEVLMAGTYTTGTPLNVRLQVSGRGTTTLAATVWSGEVEPLTPTLTRTDATASLQAPGSVGVLAYLSGSALSPVTVQVTAFSARPVV